MTERLVGLKSIHMTFVLPIVLLITKIIQLHGMLMISNQAMSKARLTMSFLIA